ncbi:MAG: hypothetical protein Kow00129_15670 [Thermoleophilia bacterium]
MAWIVDVELVSLEEGAPGEDLEIVFDVVYPGETWTRSIVRVTPAARAALEVGSGGPAGRGVAGSGLVSRARDVLLFQLEREVSPVSLDLRLEPERVEVLVRRRADLG